MSCWGRWQEAPRCALGYLSRIYRAQPMGEIAKIRGVGGCPGAYRRPSDALYSRCPGTARMARTLITPDGAHMVVFGSPKEILGV